jgi:hypothetical protein
VKGQRQLAQRGSRGGKAPAAAPRQRELAMQRLGAERAQLDHRPGRLGEPECDLSRVERRRRELGVTALPLIARATIETLLDFPDLNATLDGTTLTRHERVYLGIAVSLGDDGDLSDSMGTGPRPVVRWIADEDRPQAPPPPADPSGGWSRSSPA